MIDIDHHLVSSTTRFAFKLFAELARQERGKNVFISPASVALALMMTYNGARGETQQAMAETLELGGMGLEEINQASATLVRALDQIDPRVRLAIANSLWIRQGIAFRPDFMQRTKEHYGAELFELDFAAASVPATINAWVQKQTNGKIEKIIDRIDPAAILFLINAIYFKGNWTRQFDQRQTREGAFTLLDGRQKQHPLMAQSGKYRYYQGRGFQAVSLPYGSGRLSMYIYLPEQSSTLERFCEGLNSKSWDAWMREFRETEGHIALPRFKLEYQATLNDALKALGMAIAFDRRQADFMGMYERGPGVNIDEVKHKTFVEVNEEGTEAAAVTSVGMVMATFAPSRTFSMIVDRPFFCAIRDNQTGALLFMGSIVEPK